MTTPTTTKRHRVGRRAWTVLAALGVALSASACANDAGDIAADAAESDVDADDHDGEAESAADDADPDDDGDAPGVATANTGGLTDDEVAGLLWMREEEQLAHDVYTALGEVWDVRAFENIAMSEQRHIETTIGLLDVYGIDDPAAGNDAGEFTNPDIQALYDQLVAAGADTEVAALEAGALIEELDIADLRERADATEVADIDAAYARLERGSRNHLRAFISQLEARGVAYVPTVLSQADFDAIVSSPTERGRD